MANNLIVKNGGDNFPAITGTIEEETEAVVAEVGVGRIVEERGMARLYLIWQSNKFLEAKIAQVSCDKCNDSFISHDVKKYTGQDCLKCAVGTYISTDIPQFPTLESYLEHISESTGRSRQTLFNRIRVYNELIDRGVKPEDVFTLNLISAGAGKLLADADEEEDEISLVDDSWQKTVDVAIGAESKGAALSFIKYDVLGKPRVTTEMEGDDTIVVIVEKNLGKDNHIISQYKVLLKGNWPEDVLKHVRRKFSAMY